MSETLLSHQISPEKFDVIFNNTRKLILEKGVNLHKRRNFPFTTLNHLQSQYPSQIKEGFVGNFLSEIAQI